MTYLIGIPQKGASQNSTGAPNPHSKFQQSAFPQVANSGANAFPNAIIGSPTQVANNTSASTFPNAVTVGAGDSVSSIANTVYGDSSQWRQVATYNGMTLFSQPLVGTQVNIPNSAGIASKYASLLPSSVVKLDNTVKSKVTNIINSRNGQTIQKLLAVAGIKLNTSALLQKLDLSTLTKGLPNPSAQDTAIYKLIQWVL